MPTEDAILTALHFTDDAAARKVIEAVRWPNGPVCHHCGESERRYATRCRLEGCWKTLAALPA